MNHPRCALAVFSLVCLVAVPAGAQTTAELKRMSLRDLLDIELTTVSRVPEATTTVPAAVFVITQDDIRRSGATSIPEVLRLAPGMQVARINAGTWSIGMRGFADRLARSMLVLIDGRAVYSPLFAGTYWETQDTRLSDVDRIEIVRGPGGTLWGANAVNGIVNIITKPAGETQGLQVGGGTGTEDRVFGAIRYGGTAGAMAYRTYFKAFNRVSHSHADGNDFDGWRAGQAGFRADWTLSDRRTMTIQGDAYNGRLGQRPSVALYTAPFVQTTNLDAPLSGGNVLGRFNQRLTSNQDVQLQVYYDRTNRTEIPVEEHRDTADVDFQHSIRWPRTTVTWGAGYRVTSGRITAVAPTAITPNRRTDNLFSAFLQDELSIVPNRWRLTIGSKFEHNDYSGLEYQPSVRLLWTPDSVHTFFWSATRAVRTPSRVETDYTTTSLVSPATPTFVRLLPNPSFGSEELRAYEMGYRLRPGSQLYVTLSGFFNHLKNIVSTELGASFTETDPAPIPARLILPVSFRNGLHGNAHGVEVTVDGRVTPWWRITGNYSYLDVQMSKNPGSADVSQERRYEGLIPHHQWQLGSSFDGFGRGTLDWQFRHVSALTAGPVPGYGTFGARAGWQLTRELQLVVVGQDLLNDRHLEWFTGAGLNTEIRRSLWAGFSWRR